MKMWFAPGSEAPLYRQLGTQIILAILSGDLKPGEKLPSTRALARRFGVHPNTVSSAYQQLEQENWVESRRGSGVYVKDRKPHPMTPEQVLDEHIAGFFRAVRELGLPEETVRAQVARWLAAPPPDHLLLLEADTALARIFVAELSAFSTLPIKVIAPESCRADRRCLAGAVPLCRPSRKLIVQEAVGVGVELMVLPINSALTWLAPLVSATPGQLIAVVSHWPEFVETGRTMLLSAGVSGDALISVDANDSSRLPGLAAASAILCDVYTAALPELPPQPQRFVFPLLAESAKQMLGSFKAPPSPPPGSARTAAPVTPSKLS
jgi:DNA-binding transcriptional regulator YhcF (GntR family)